MPLPEKSIPWPPAAYQRVMAHMGIWSAWYSGTSEALSEAYGAQSVIDPASPFDRNGILVQRPSTYRGGVVGKIARFFWGAPTPVNQRPHKLHVPIAGDIASTSADLLFGEMPRVTVQDQATQDRLDEFVGAAHAKLLEAAELQAALGGVYLRIAWDTSIAEHPWLAVGHADAAVPEWTWDRLAAVTFWEVLEGPNTPGRDGTTVVRHLERHEPGRILHGLYEGSVDQLGRPVPLTEHAATRQLAGIVDEHSSIPTNITQLTACYVPNMKPTRLWRADPAAVNLGRSDYAGIEGVMDALDETWTSLMRDVRLGKSRLIVPNAYLQNLGKGHGTMFNDEQEVYSGLDMLPRPDGTDSMITENQFKIRSEELGAIADRLLNQAIRQAGYSTATFGEDADQGSTITATEVTARQRKTMTTRSRKIGYWRPELAGILEAQLAIDAQLAGRITPERPTVEWPDAVAPDPGETAHTLQALRASESASIQTRVKMLHPDWDDTEVAEEVERIKTEEQIAGHVPDPASFGGQPE